MTKLFDGALEAFIAKAEPQCIITGCGLVQHSAWSWGDLHEFGGLVDFPRRESRNGLAEL